MPLETLEVFEGEPGIDLLGGPHGHKEEHRDGKKDEEGDRLMEDSHGGPHQAETVGARRRRAAWAAMRARDPASRRMSSS